VNWGGNVYPFVVNCNVYPFVVNWGGIFYPFVVNWVIFRSFGLIEIDGLSAQFLPVSALGKFTSIYFVQVALGFFPETMYYIPSFFPSFINPNMPNVTSHILDFDEIQRNKFFKIIPNSSS